MTTPKLPTTAPLAFARPADLPPGQRALADALWNATTEDADDALAALLGLGPGDGHDELTRCDVDGCDAWFWADCGATVAYESGRELTVCATHAVPDDPGARIYPGAALAADWQAQREADESRRIRTTGRAR